MNPSSKIFPLLIFIGILLVSIVLGRMGSIYLLDHYTDDYTAHAFIDFAAKIDTIGKPFEVKIPEPTSINSALITALLVMPCFVFGWVILRKKNYTQLVAA